MQGAPLSIVSGIVSLMLGVRHLETERPWGRNFSTYLIAENDRLFASECWAPRVRFIFGGYRSADRLFHMVVCSLHDLHKLCGATCNVYDSP